MRKNPQIKLVIQYRAITHKRKEKGGKKERKRRKEILFTQYRTVERKKGKKNSKRREIFLDDMTRSGKTGNFFKKISKKKL